MGRMPAAAPTPADDEAPLIVPSYVVDAPPGVKLCFYSCKFDRSSLPAESTNDVEMGSVVCCELGLSESTANKNGNPLLGNDTAVMNAVKDCATGALEYDASTSAVVSFGNLQFLIPTRLKGEDFEVDDLAKMVAVGCVRPLFNEEMSDVSVLAGKVLSGVGKFDQISSCDSIEAKFGDDVVAHFKVDAQGTVVPFADQTLGPDDEGKKIASGDDLAARAALCEISKVNNGKLKLPLVRSSDLRIAGPKTVEYQTSTFVEKFLRSDDGIAADVSKIKTFDHAEQTPEPDCTFVEMKITRSHLRADCKNLATNEMEYPVAVAVYICIGRANSFKVTLCEVPPPEDDTPVIACSATEAVSTIETIVKVSRDVAAQLPAFVAPKAVDEAQHQSPAEQARAEAQQKREQMKADLTKTMGGGKFSKNEPRE